MSNPILPEQVAVRPSPVAGKGLFAELPIARGQTIAYVGKVVSTEAAHPALEAGNRYLFGINDDLMIDGESMDNLGRWLNHACDPNCDVVVDEKERTVTFVTTRALEPGEELTINYGPDYLETFIADCRCPNCRAPKIDVDQRGVWLTSPSGVSIGVRWTAAQRAQIREWFAARDEDEAA